MMQRPRARIAFRARPNLRFRGVDWPLFAILGGLGTGISFLVILAQNPLTRWTGIAWIALGFLGYSPTGGASSGAADRDRASAASRTARRWRSSTGGCSCPSWGAASPTRRSTSRAGSRPSGGDDLGDHA